MTDIKFSWAENRPPRPLIEFWDACNQFDWYYNFSDDHRIWQTWRPRHNMLLEGVKALGVDAELLYKQWYGHHFNEDNGFTGPALDKPPRPE
jgi:hypothetical protein